MMRHVELPDLDFEKGAAGMQPGHDALALARTVDLAPGMRVLDLGTGQGVIALMLAARERVHVLGVDRERDTVAIAERNAAANAFLLKGSVRWMVGDVRQLPLRRAQFDLVVMNPPYHRAGEGRLPPEPLRAVARHELHGLLEDWVRAAAASLRAGGTLACVHLPRRCDELVRLLEETGYGEIRADLPNATNGAPPAWCIVQARLARVFESATTSR
jgi:tRNA1Val (adenine37-N6)-methyltransferase